MELTRLMEQSDAAWWQARCKVGTKQSWGKVQTNKEMHFAPKSQCFLGDAVTCCKWMKAEMQYDFQRLHCGRW